MYFANVKEISERYLLLFDIASSILSALSIIEDVYEKPKEFNISSDNKIFPHKAATLTLCSLADERTP